MTTSAVEPGIIRHDVDTGHDVIATADLGAIDHTPHVSMIKFDGGVTHPTDALQAPGAATAFRIAYQQAVFYRRVAQAAIALLHQRHRELSQKDTQITALRSELRTARGIR